MDKGKLEAQSLILVLFKTRLSVTVLWWLNRLTTFLQLTACHNMHCQYISIHQYENEIFSFSQLFRSTCPQRSRESGTNLGERWAWARWPNHIQVITYLSACQQGWESVLIFVSGMWNGWISYGLSELRIIHIIRQLLSGISSRGSLLVLLSFSVMQSRSSTTELLYLWCQDVYSSYSMPRNLFYETWPPRQILAFYQGKVLDLNCQYIKYINSDKQPIYPSRLVWSTLTSSGIPNPMQRYFLFFWLLMGDTRDLEVAAHHSVPQSYCLFNKIDSTVLTWS